MTNKLTFIEFINKLKTLEELAEAAINESKTLESFFDDLSEHNISLESVVTGDVAQVTKPIMHLRRKQVYETAPSSKEAEKWILSNKAAFKKRYGEDWQQILYATAWKLFKK